LANPCNITVDSKQVKGCKKSLLLANVVGDVSEKPRSVWVKANAVFAGFSCRMRFLPYNEFIVNDVDVIASSHAHLKQKKTTSSVIRAGSGNKELPAWYLDPFPSPIHLFSIPATLNSSKTELNLFLLASHNNFPKLIPVH